MTDLVFHKAEKYIEEDLEYYFSGERDIHSQVKPGQNIYSFTPDSAHLNIDFNDGKIGNLFFPFAPGSLDRVYIGISFPLFANNWGTAFLRHLMTLVKPDGCVVLPVYPEMQASEKNFWARSILENIFISRSRWKGMSNIWAENDGVMSMRIGRKDPPEIASTANYLLRESSQAVLRHAFKSDEDSHNPDHAFLELHRDHWKTMPESAVIEVIIRDHFGRKNEVAICTLGESDNNTLLATELVLSDYIKVGHASSQHIANSAPIHAPEDMIAYNGRQLQQKLTVNTGLTETLADKDKYNVITVIDSLAAVATDERSSLISSAWQKLETGGLLIIRESSANNGITPSDIEGLVKQLGQVKHYSSIVASEIKTGVEISHYSLLIEQELRDEQASKEGVFWIVQK